MRERSDAQNDRMSPPLRCSRRGFVRIAALRGEEWIEGEPISDTESFISELRKNRVADVLTIVRPLLDHRRCVSYDYDWDNVAIARTDDFRRWWEALPQETRKNVRRSQRRGVIVKVATFDDELVRGISRIYDETPIRQGRRFPHYGKRLFQVKEENASYHDRATFLGAYHDGALVGFVKLVRVNSVFRIMQIVALESHADKRPTNALLAKAIEMCCDSQTTTHMVYGKYIYGRKENSPVTEFKRRNGFEQMRFPRYYIPLTRFGKLAVKIGLHRTIDELLPEPIFARFLHWRAAYYRRRYRRGNEPKEIGSRSESASER